MDAGVVLSMWPKDRRKAANLRSLSSVATPSRVRLIAFGRYLLVIVFGNVVWEFAQTPLYTIWQDGTPRHIAFAALHCTAGDLLIAASALLAAIALVGGPHWPRRRFGAVGTIAVAAGLLYTVFSEWLNTDIRGNWAYTTLMPKLPLIGTGLAPLVQWLVVPTVALLWARRGVRQPGSLPNRNAA